jgi:tape measure domain-containing protein
MSSIVKFGLGTAIAGFGASLTGLFASMKKDAAWEQTSIKFETLIGDAGKAKLILGDLQKFAASTPLSFESIADGAINLMAFGTAAEDALDEMRMMGDLSMGNSDKMDRLVQAYGKLQSKGKASMEEINRFTEAGVPLLDQLGKNLGKSTEEVYNLVSAGKIGFVDVQDALQDLTGEGGKFAGMLEKQADTVNGKWSTLKDTLSLTMIKVGEAMRPFTSSVLDSAISKLNAFMESEGFNSFIETTVRWASWAMGMIPKIGAVFWFVGEVIAITARHALAALNSLKDIVVDTPVIKFVMDIGGRAYEAIKKGFQTGDWSEALGVGADIFRTGIVVLASIKLGEAAVSALWTATQMAFKSSKFLTGVSGIGMAGVVAGASVAVGLIEATGSGNWGEFKNNISAAIIGGLIAGGLTKSPQAGFWAASIVFNLDIPKLVDKLPDPQEAADAFKGFMSDLWNLTGIEQWWNDIGQDIGDAFITGITNALKLFDIVGAFVTLWDISSSTISEWWASKGEDIGKIFTDTLWKVISTFDIVGAFVDLWNTYGTKVIDTVKGWFGFDVRTEAENMADNFGEGFVLGLEKPSFWTRVTDWWKNILNIGKSVLDERSPSKEGEGMGLFLAAGFLNGLNNSGYNKKISGVWEKYLESARNILGIHSASDETEEDGKYMLEGFLNGITDSSLLGEIMAAWEVLMEKLELAGVIDVEAVISSIKGENKPPEDPPKEEKTGFSALGSSLSGSFNDSQLGSLISGFGSTISSFIGGLGGAITSLGSIQAILNPLTTIFSGMMEVLGPVIDSVLSPLVGILKILGQTIGKILTPVIQWLSPIIGYLGEVFIWLYNKILVPVGNGFITVFNAIGIGIASIVNGVISAINWALGWAGVNLNKVNVPGLDDGKLTAISTGDLTAAGSSYIGGGSGSGVSGSSTSVQSYNIEVHQVVQGNVIGDGGMTELGRFFVEAVEAYLGSGGRVSFVRG